MADLIDESTTSITGDSALVEGSTAPKLEEGDITPPPSQTDSADATTLSTASITATPEPRGAGQESGSTLTTLSIATDDASSTTTAVSAEESSTTAELGTEINEEEEESDDRKGSEESSSAGILSEAVLLKVSEDSPLISLPRQYANVNERRNVDLNDLDISVDSTDGWKVYERIGKGKYSEVFEGKRVGSSEKCCVKILRPCKPQLLKLEIFVLQELQSGPNIIHLLNTLQDPRSELFCLVFELLNAREFKDLYHELTDNDMRYYLFEMLRGLDYAHSKGIMHRDIKPQNILVDTKNRKVRLIDWGLAAFYFPGHEYTVRVATRAYKAPELLIDYNTYHYSIDVWAFGCMLAGIVFQTAYFFHGGPQEGDQLLKIVQVLGTEDLLKLSDKLHIELPDYVQNDWDSYPRREWSEFLSDSSDKNKFVTKNALDIMDKMLRYDPAARLTAFEAMMHPYFDRVRSHSTYDDGSVVGAIKMAAAVPSPGPSSPTVKKESLSSTIESKSVPASTAVTPGSSAAASSTADSTVSVTPSKEVILSVDTQGDSKQDTSELVSVPSDKLIIIDT